MEYEWNSTIFGLKMMMKSGLEIIFLKSHHVQSLFQKINFSLDIFWNFSGQSTVPSLRCSLHHNIDSVGEICDMKHFFPSLNMWYLYYFAAKFHQCRLPEAVSCRSAGQTPAARLHHPNSFVDLRPVLQGKNKSIIGLVLTKKSLLVAHTTW
jgi:hypothetical protein